MKAFTLLLFGRSFLTAPNPSERPTESLKLSLNPFKDLSNQSDILGNSKEAKKSQNDTKFAFNEAIKKLKESKSVFLIEKSQELLELESTTNCIFKASFSLFSSFAKKFNPIFSNTYFEALKKDFTNSIDKEYEAIKQIEAHHDFISNAELKGCPPKLKNHFLNTQAHYLKLQRPNSSTNLEKAFFEIMSLIIIFAVAIGLILYIIFKRK